MFVLNLADHSPTRMADVNQRAACCVGPGAGPERGGSYTSRGPAGHAGPGTGWFGFGFNFGIIVLRSGFLSGAKAMIRFRSGW